MTPSLSSGGRISKMSMQRTTNKLEPKEANLGHLRAESPLKVTIARSFARKWQKKALASRGGDGAAQDDDAAGLAFAGRCVGGAGGAASPHAAEQIDTCMICCEILDSRTRNSLCMNPAVSNEAEYVLSHITIAKVLAMVAMRREIKLVLSELLEDVGQSFFVLPVTRYLPPELVAAAHARGTSATGGGGDDGGGDNEPIVELSFWQLGARVRACGEVLVGYQLFDAEMLMINPPDKATPIGWGPNDCVVVICNLEQLFSDEVASPAKSRGARELKRANTIASMQSPERLELSSPYPRPSEATSPGLAPVSAAVGGSLKPVIARGRPASKQVHPIAEDERVTKK